MAPPTPHPPFFCTKCEYSTIKSGNLRRHVSRHHKDVVNSDLAELERHILEVRYPKVDFDTEVQRYVDKKETVWTMMDKGYRLTRYLRLLGVLRPVAQDKVLQRIFKYGSANPNDNTEFVKTMMERYGVDNATKNPDLIDRAISTKLRNQGLNDLVEPYLMLRKIRKIMKDRAEGAKNSEET